MSLKLESQKEYIINLYSKGFNCAQIAKNLNEYPQSVVNLLKYYSIYKSSLPNQGNVRYFKVINSHVKAYLLGFIAADGCLTTNGKNSYGLTITIHSKDIQILKLLRNEIRCDNKIYEIHGKASHNPNKITNHCRFQLFNKKLYDDIISYGIIPLKSTRLDNILSNIPYEFRNSFIIGFFDGNGSASYNSSSNQMLVSIRSTEAFLIGVAKHINPAKYKIVKDKTKESFTFSIWRKSDINLFYTLYNNLNFYLDRKHSRLSSFLKIDEEETISSSLRDVGRSCGNYILQCSFIP